MNGVSSDGRRVHVGVREAPMAKAREQAHQQEQRAACSTRSARRRSRRQCERQHDGADTRAVEQRRVRALVEQLARQQLVERVRERGADQQQRTAGCMTAEPGRNRTRMPTKPAIDAIQRAARRVLAAAAARTARR